MPAAARLRRLRWVAVSVSAVSVLAHATYPLDTEDTATQGAGNVELENGLSLGRRAGMRTASYQPQVSLGRTATLDVILQPSWLLQSGGAAPSRNGTGDTNLDFKWRFFGQAPWSLALRAGAASDCRAGPCRHTPRW